MATYSLGASSGSRPPPPFSWRHWPTGVDTYLLVVQVLLEPVPDVGRGLAVADVHEAQSPDVGAVAVVQQPHQLLAGQLQREKLEEQAKR